ncbi:hypothetical protein Anapl_11870 [Anas platyrhynchos]|uniref:Uncharacterized protein n=1 Tax=Anas platyrhynchos TaxID=8839 RepID=R0LSB0_ANAPL|nr:hypothetical protein Anapl_11870 [Anas platyrhynchos]
MPPVRPSCDKGPVTIASLVGTDSGSAVKKKVLAAWVTPGEPGAAPSSIYMYHHGTCFKSKDNRSLGFVMPTYKLLMSAFFARSSSSYSMDFVQRDKKRSPDANQDNQEPLATCWYFNQQSY